MYVKILQPQNMHCMYTTQTMKRHQSTSWQTTSCSTSQIPCTWWNL